MKVNTVHVLLICILCGLALGNVFAQTPELVVQTGHSASVDGMTLNSNGSLLATTSSRDQKIKLYEVSTRRELRTFTGAGDDQPSCETLAFSPDSRTLVTGELSKIRFWDVVRGKLIRTVPTEEWITSLTASPSGNFFVALSTSGSDTTTEAIRVWDFNGNLLYTLMERPLSATRLYNSGSIAFNDNGTTLASIDGEHTITLWDLPSRKTIRIVKHDNDMHTAIFYSSLYNDFVISDLTETGDGWSFEISQLTTGKELYRISRLDDPSNVTVTTLNLAAKIFVTGDEGGTVTVYNLADQSKVVLPGHSEVSTGVLFSPDGRSLVTINGLHVGSLARPPDVNLVKVWDLSGATVLHTLSGHTKQVNCIAFSADSKSLASGSDDGTVRLWDLDTRTEVRMYNMALPLTSVAFSPDAKLLAAGTEWPGSYDSDLLRVWETNTGTVLPGPHLLEYGVKSVAFSPDGNKLVAGLAGLSQGAKAIKLWDALNWKEISTTTTQELPVDFLAFSPNGAILASGGMTGGVELLDIISGGDTSRRIAPFSGGPLAFNPNGKELVRAKPPGGEIHTWDIASGMESEGYATTLYQHSWTAIAFSPDGRTLASGGDGPAVHLWNVTTRREFIQLVSLAPDTWVVVSPDGRFDTNNMDEIKGLHWVFPDDPFRALAPEIFARDYYEPGLLPQLLAGKELPKIRPLASLNRVQPLVEVEKAEWQDSAEGKARVTLKVSGNNGMFPRDGKEVEVSTGVYDLRVFRNGQLVGWAPKSSVDWQLEPPPTGAHADELDLERWREKTRIDLGRDGSKELTFTVQVPRRADLKQVTFTAYAFNEDRVKSATASRTLEVSSALKARTGKAYIISVGVNRTESSPAWDLQYAANDARKLSEVVSQRLGGTRQFGAVVPLVLVSDQPGQERAEEAGATKVHLQAVLDVLAGRRTVDEQLKREIPDIEKVEKAEPEDLVLLAFSSHGYTDERGVFHMVLADIGKNQPQDRITEELQKRTLSSDELSGWLREVDAGELVMIVDTCHSEATVAYDGFKPGPMGSRGLGQLAYDKGMRILAASKSGQSAIELGGEIKEGLLSYALVHEGLEEGKADFQPKDGKIQVSEWLAYGAQEVPNLFSSGQVKGSKGEKPTVNNTRDIIYLGPDQAPPSYQQPVLFDFSRKGNDALLMSLAPQL